VRFGGVLLVAIAVALVLAGSARADKPKPWAEGVSAENQKKALALYDAGNKLFGDDNYKDALAQYEQALAFWKHPAVYYNAAVCLLNLDRPVEAYDDFTEAMKYGADPIGADHFNQAKNYLKALSGQVASLEVRSKYENGDVQLDGGPLLHGAGDVTRRVRAGSHQIVATADNYKPQTETVVVDPKKVNVVVIELQPLPAAKRFVRRWPVWKPWAIAGAGAVLAGVGGGATFIAYENVQNNNNFRNACINDASNNYCAGYGTSSSAADHAKYEFPAGIAALSVGGALLVTGAVMFYLNQGHMTAVTPTFDGEHAGLVISGRW